MRYTNRRLFHLLYLLDLTTYKFNRTRNIQFRMTLTSWQM